MRKELRWVRWVVGLFVIQAFLLLDASAQTTGEVTEVKLDNGLTVLLKEVHAAPVFTAQVWFKVGSRNEHTGITGISHMLEHMLFNSSKHYRKGEITEMIRERGGIENAATWTDFTYYWQLLSKEHLEFAVKTLAERVGNALLLEPEFQNERTVVLSELQGHENDPATLLDQGVMATAFTAHEYQWPVIGWQSDVENINRDQLVNHYRSYYYPNNATLVLVGDFDSAEAKKLILKYFGKTHAEKLPRPPYTVEPPQRGPRTIVVRREGNAERVLVGYHIPGIDNPDTYALMVLGQILSGGRSSRLYQALVEKQLAVSAWADPDIRKDPALFMAGATGRQGVTADQLEKALAAEIERIKTSLPIGDEMQAAKNQLEADTIFANDSVSSQGEQLGYYNTIASWRYLETLIPRIKAVTPEDVQRVARQYLVTDNQTIGKFIPIGGTGHPDRESSSVGPVHYTENPEADLRVCSRSASRMERASSAHAEAAKAAQPFRTVLRNGMVVIVQENHSNPTVAISGNLTAGSCFDHAGKAGVASLTAEMMARGTRKRTALELAKASEFVGASIDTSAGVESANFSAKALSRDFGLVLDLLSDELRNSAFPLDQFEKAKGEMLSAIEQSRESTGAQASRAFYNSVFPPAHPYHQLTLEQATNELQAVTKEDLVAFHRSYYRPDTTVIVIVGDVTTNGTAAAIEKFFGDWTAAGSAPVVDIPTVLPQTQPKRIVIPMMDKSEVHIIYGYAFGMRRSDPDFYAARLMNQILGGAGALASILGEEIREKRGLAYDIHSTFDATRGAGPWYIALGTSSNHADKVVALLGPQIAEFKKRGSTKEQFERAREFAIGVFPIALETNDGMARVLLNAEFYGLGMDYIQNYPKIYRAVTLGQVAAAAQKYLQTDTGTLVIAGPYQEHMPPSQR